MGMTHACGATAAPGMLMAARDLLREHPHPASDEIRHALEGSLCRRTGYGGTAGRTGRGDVAMRSARRPDAPSAPPGLGKSAHGATRLCTCGRRDGGGAAERGRFRRGAQTGGGGARGRPGARGRSGSCVRFSRR
ncbi:2Fe-2S iron-sulfur cluster-binding protein [Streptomyces longisporus]|uniref:2Fe-2S iron-sulfur cluster-binding protein n=1 Tax=Streptomyces longisporus TaxID=1948 RepID=UPI003CD08180